MSDNGKQNTDQENRIKMPSSDVLFQIFTDSNIVIIVWFLAVYFIVYLLLNIFRGKGSPPGTISRWIDVISLLCLLIYVGFTYFSKSESEKKQIIRNLYIEFSSYLNSPLSLLSIGFFIFTLYTVIYILAIPMDSIGKPITITVVENIAWIMFVLVLVANSISYLTGKSITDFMDSIVNHVRNKAEDSELTASMTSQPYGSNTLSGNTSVSNSKIANLLSGSSGVSNQQLANLTAGSSGVNNQQFIKFLSGSFGISPEKISNILSTSGGASNQLVANVLGNTSSVPVEFNEVFNIGNNMYTYDDAQSVCASFDARLATYDEVEDTYNKGGEWCNYGWSEGQSAYFPTQKQTWQNLQKSEKTKNACGRPGVNGGYIENPNARFGVNCFGKKPKPKDSDLKSISSGKAGVNVPKSQEDILLEKKIKFWKDNGDKLFTINSYNNNKWSMY